VQRLIEHPVQLADMPERERPGRRTHSALDLWPARSDYAEHVYDGFSNDTGLLHVILDVTSDGPPELGREFRHHFKGRLPYHLHTRSVIVELDPPRTVVADVGCRMSDVGCRMSDVGCRR
jgi:hypothetical protein